MSNELQAFLSTGSTLYALLLNSVGQVWNGSAFEAVNGDNWATYDIALTESVAGLYTADMPAVDAGVYSYVVYNQAGDNPANTDEWAGNGYLEWDGTTVLPLSTIENGVDQLTSGSATLETKIDAINTDSLLDAIVEDTYTLQDFLQIMGGVLAGKSSGGGTTTITFRNISDSGSVIEATVDNDGNRTEVLLNT